MDKVKRKDPVQREETPSPANDRENVMSRPLPAVRWGNSRTEGIFMETRCKQTALTVVLLNACWSIKFESSK